jgi:nitronate monooxygenase
MAQPEYKQMVVDAGPDDLVVSSSVTGTPASWLRPSLVAAGQGLEAVRAVEPMAQIVDQLSGEYDAAVARFRTRTEGRRTHGAAA